MFASSIHHPHIYLLLVATALGACSSRDSSSSEQESAEPSRGAASVAASASADAAPRASSSAVPSASAAAPDPCAAPALALVDADLVPDTIPAQRDAMIRRMKALGTVDDGQAEKLLVVLEQSSITGQGNPAVTEYAMTRAECIARRKEACVVDPVHPVCGSPYMVPVYDAEKGETPETAKLCIDAYEFPGIPCDYPVTWISPRQAELACEAVGKRLCDAHEWEGACAGRLLPPEEEYDFDRARSHGNARRNKGRTKVWAYGAEKDNTRCAMAGKQSKKCVDSRYKVCGSNTYPTGAFPGCKSALGVYDQHGNAAEHMSFPRKLEDLGARGGHGMTEMKGSWFIHQRFEPHEDDCRWRAPAWHESALMAVKGHANYHLGFRCCKDVGR